MSGSVRTSESDAEIACEWVLSRVRREARGRWLQGPLAAPLPCEVASGPVRLFAERRFRRVPMAVGRALVAWAHGRRRAVLRFDVPTPREVLALQARGARCVSLVDDADAPTPHATGLEFAIHDLCHLEKLSDPEHHEAQVGFFHALDTAFASPRWADLERALATSDHDRRAEPWAAGRDHVASDMNGSAVFLFLALKTKLLAAARQAEHPADMAMAALCEVLELSGPVADAAIGVRSRASDPALLSRLHAHFEQRGRDVLAGLAQ